MNRRSLSAALILLLASLGALTLSCSALCAAIVGPGASAPGTIEDGEIGPQARALVAASFSDFEGRRPVDFHVHVAGLGAGGTGCTVNPRMRSFLHPWLRIQFSIYMAAAGVDELDRADEQYVERLLELWRAVEPRPRLGLLALDHRYGEDGTLDADGSPIHVPNDHVLRLAREHEDAFFPVVSVHPYRKDAAAELERCAAAGARLVKWLPNSMGIDPADSRCDPFYERLASLGMTLLTHAGDEKALEAEGGRDLGNPLRLRRALERGARVVVAHCASLGTAEDLDDPTRSRVECFDLFLRMMEEPQWERLLYGELSATCLRNRDPRVLRTLLERTDLHERLVDGSDWPLPAIRATTSLRRFERAGLLTRSEREALDEIRDANPLLFDFVLKRTLRGPRGERFPASVFLRRPEILP